MLRVTCAAVGCALAIGAAWPGTAAAVPVSGDGCETIRILPDGREVRSQARRGPRMRGRSSRSASSVSVSSGSGSVRSSSYASASSSGSTSSSRAVSSTTDAEGRTITVTREDNRCTIVVDER